MQTIFIIDKNTVILAIPRHDGTPCGTEASSLLGRRFDSCVARKSGEIMLHALLDGYRGLNSPRQPVILDFKHNQPFCAYLKVEPVFSPDGASDTLECRLEY